MIDPDAGIRIAASVETDDRRMGIELARRLRSGDPNVGERTSCCCSTNTIRICGTDLRLSMV